MFYILNQRTSDELAFLSQNSHWDTNFFGGEAFPADFAIPVQFEIDLDSDGRRMPTLFTTPALIVRREFHELLVGAGVDNLDAYPALIQNTESGEQIQDYVVLNILGNISAADLGANPGFELGPGIRVLDEPVLRREAVRDALMFRLAEDPIQIVVAEKIAQKIRAAGLADVHLAEAKIS